MTDCREMDERKGGREGGRGRKGEREREKEGRRKEEKTKCTCTCRLGRKMNKNNSLNTH